MSVKYHVGDVTNVLQREIPDQSVHCVVTSPPYHGLRDYGVDGQIGLEKSLDDYLSILVGVFREVRRVLRPDGTLWLNVGDAYAAKPVQLWRNDWGSTQTIPPQNLLGIPWRMALALQSDGWWLRSDIIWAKPNPMPSSVKNRPTSSHEHLFLLTRSPRYYYDHVAVREPASSEFAKKGRQCHPETMLGVGSEKRTGLHRQTGSTTRNLRDVWTIPTQPVKEKHYATFPEKLVEPCIKAGTSERGCCPECGTPWRRRLSKPTGGTTGQSRHDHSQDAEAGNMKTGSSSGYRSAETLGWDPGCDCRMCKKYADGTRAYGPHPPVPCTVLDPFAGSGTTALVAERLGRDAILIDLDPRNVEIYNRRRARMLEKS